MKILITSDTAIICDGINVLCDQLKKSFKDNLDIQTNSRKEISKSNFNIDWGINESIKSSGISNIKFDVVINTVSIPYQMKSITQKPFSFLLKSNLITRNILTNLKFDHFIQISSPSVYLVNWLKRDTFSLEDSHYLGEIKIAEDIFAKNYCHEIEKKITIFRPKSILSKKENPRDSNGHIFSEITFKLLNKKLDFITIKSLSTQELKFLSPNDMWSEISNLIKKDNKNSLKTVEGEGAISMLNFIKEVVYHGFKKNIINNNVKIKFEDKEVILSSKSYKLIESSTYQLQLVRNYLDYHYG